MRWSHFLIGYIVGSFFGLMNVLALLKGLGGKK